MPLNRNAANIPRPLSPARALVDTGAMIAAEAERPEVTELGADANDEI